MENPVFVFRNKYQLKPMQAAHSFRVVPTAAAQRVLTSSSYGVFVHRRARACCVLKRRGLQVQHLRLVAFCVGRPRSQSRSSLHAHHGVSSGQRRRSGISSMRWQHLPVLHTQHLGLCPLRIWRVSCQSAASLSVVAAPNNVLVPTRLIAEAFPLRCTRAAQHRR